MKVKPLQIPERPPLVTAHEPLVHAWRARCPPCASRVVHQRPVGNGFQLMLLLPFVWRTVVYFLVVQQTALPHAQSLRPWSGPIHSSTKYHPLPSHKGQSDCTTTACRNWPASVLFDTLSFCSSVISSIGVCWMRPAASSNVRSATFKCATRATIAQRPAPLTM